MLAIIALRVVPNDNPAGSPSEQSHRAIACVSITHTQYTGPVLSNQWWQGLQIGKRLCQAAGAGGPIIPGNHIFHARLGSHRWRKLIKTEFDRPIPPALFSFQTCRKGRIGLATFIAQKVFVNPCFNFPILRPLLGRASVQFQQPDFFDYVCFLCDHQFSFNKLIKTRHNHQRYFIVQPI